MMESFPPDVLERIVSFVGVPRDMLRFGCVCRSFNSACNAPHVWQELAAIKFGKDLAMQSAPLYRGDWKKLMVDGNKLGALPTLPDKKVCMWKYNLSFGRLFYCCIVKCVKWDRAANTIRVYIDVRGENDLRDPCSSSLILRTFAGVVQVRPSHRMQPLWNALPSTFQQDMMPNRRHRKGCLVFPAPDLPGQYTFCYACERQHHRTDYQPVALFVIPEGTNGLERAFGIDTEEVCYTSKDSPFVDDTPEVERARWLETVPAEILGDSRPGFAPSWYRDA